MTRWQRFKAWLGMHVWEYRNPADRTCLVCGRSECEFTRGSLRDSWWEAIREGDPRKHRQPTDNVEGE